MALKRGYKGRFAVETCCLCQTQQRVTFVSFVVHQLLHFGNAPAVYQSKEIAATIFVDHNREVFGIGIEGLSQIEVGQKLGVSDEAVESLLARARRALKVSLADEWRELLEE